MGIFEAESYVSLLVYFGVLATVIFAFVNSLLYSAESYEAAGKLTKPAWCTILGLGVVLQFVSIGLFIVQIALFIAALVYLADVRPALGSLRRR
ncbi:DUF2516 family protein [Nocardioides sp.]|uniref:DUF2516 family protein n=1 Tax=Nocardioides sp. TaxID=35761 RepID=UPI002393E1C5|nr:DUF2516 family protein [Nocardioides sp.]MDE0776427.1 DUF2516 family protein [Nocardioides sp.]